MNAAYRYRIYVEGTGSNARSVIEAAVSRAKFGGFTLYSAKGYWLGRRENTFIIEIISDVPRLDDIKNLATVLRDEFSQEAVLITKDQTYTEMV